MLEINAGGKKIMEISDKGDTVFLDDSVNSDIEDNKILSDQERANKEKEDKEK